jgi:hypothetical protein
MCKGSKRGYVCTQFCIENNKVKQKKRKRDKLVRHKGAKFGAYFSTQSFSVTSGVTEQASRSTESVLSCKAFIDIINSELVRYFQLT